MSVITITKENFEQEVLKAEKTVLVDFWASWCMPCKMLSPVVDEIADEENNVKVCKINIDDEPELAQKFRVMSIPTLAVFRDGQLVDTSVGVKPKGAIVDMIKK